MHQLLSNVTIDILWQLNYTSIHALYIVLLLNNTHNINVFIGKIYNRSDRYLHFTANTIRKRGGCKQKSHGKAIWQGNLPRAILHGRLPVAVKVSELFQKFNNMVYIGIRLRRILYGGRGTESGRGSGF